jgi:hypothetical protein
VTKLRQDLYNTQQELHSLRQQLDRLNNKMFCPLCIRQLLVLADRELHQLAKRNSPTRGAQRPFPPDWVSTDINLPSVGLQEEDLDTIFSTAPGSVQGISNASTHNITVENQEEAVRSYSDREVRLRLARIFRFTHGYAVTGL